MKVTTKTLMVRVLAAALAAGCVLPAVAQDRERWGDQRRGDDDGDGEREERRRERQEQREERREERQEQQQAQQLQMEQIQLQREAAGEQQRQAYEQQQREAAEQQQRQAAEQQRQAFDQEAQRAAAYEAARQNQVRQEQQRVRAIDRQGANEVQQRAIDERNRQMAEDQARQMQQARDARGYGDTRDGNRDWNDGRRDGGRDGNWNGDRDGRYADRNDRDGRDRDGDGRDRDWEGRDGRRDGNWDRDGRGGNRAWDQTAQRRYDGWQRDADRYRREAMQRHNANRYASLQQQQRMRQYRYQQDYWNRQQRWYSGWNTRRYDRNFVVAPIVYRYSRGGRWYDINRYAADTLQQAIRIGYEEGARAGEADRYDGWRGGYRDNFVYQDADFGYDGWYVALPEYQYYFREGFRRGYEDAYGRRYRYGRYSGGEYIIAADVLSLILDLQRY